MCDIDGLTGNVVATDKSRRALFLQGGYVEVPDFAHAPSDKASLAFWMQVCCAVLCCAVLCCAVLCCAVLCCAVLCCAVLCSPAAPRYASSSSRASLCPQPCLA